MRRAEKTLLEQYLDRRKEAEERAMKLLRAHLEKGEWHGNHGRPYIWMKSQLGNTYEIRCTKTSENIWLLSKSGAKENLCGGPDQLAEFHVRDTHYVASSPLYQAARREAQEAGLGWFQPLPPGDIWLGQYLALRYDEQAFLEKANRLGWTYY